MSNVLQCVLKIMVFNTLAYYCKMIENSYKSYIGLDPEIFTITLSRIKEMLNQFISVFWIGL